ncbi:MAG: hypothetical protein RQ728_00575 [Brevefilum sp.]|nr:hypothetical protein [Brevefilum sp.]MDT8380732.1 hypothetical protein [Brevefilum sp.]MDW7754250.1 hypothetical protein [Brevefilum sp.]
MTSLRSVLKKLVRPKPFITVVSGLPRSGTSMMMSALRAGGMPLLIDGIREADANNPKGYFEYERVKKLPVGDTEWLESAEGKAVKIISALLEYLPDAFDYRVIFMEREIDEILKSQKRMLASRGTKQGVSVPDEDMRRYFQAHLEEVQSLLLAREWLKVMPISYNEILQNLVSEFQRVAAFLDGRVDPALMSGVIDPALYREKINGD